MVDDVNDIVWPIGIFEAKGGHHQKGHKNSYIHDCDTCMTAIYKELQVHVKVARHSWGLFFELQVAPIVTLGCCTIT